ncbi:hypothetical protein CR513_15735, partial [Mucuna pruriens]
MENQLVELTSLVRQLAVGKQQTAMAAKICGICTSVEHPTNMCPMLQETKSDQLENVGVIGGFQYGKQPYQTRPFVNQWYGRQSFWPRLPQGPLPTVESTTSSATFPIITAIVESAYSRQLFISSRPDEPGVPTICELQQHAIPIECDRHHPRPQNANWTISQHFEPFTVSWIQQPPFSNHSKSETKSQYSHPQKWKRTTSTYTAIVAEISCNRL